MDRIRRTRRRWVSSSFLLVVLCWLCIWTSTRTITNCQAQAQAQAQAQQQESDNKNKNNNSNNNNNSISSNNNNNNRNNGHAFLTEDSVVLITGAAGFLGSELALALYRTYSPKRIICVDRMGDHPDSQEELALFEFQRQRSFNVMQTLGDKGRFYRVDFSPMIPEYFDLGEVPVLDHIFRENPDISHVVHLADPFPHSALQAVPREKEVPKAGMMEALMEQLAKHEREGKRKSNYVPPHFVYASSFEVYPHHKSLFNFSHTADIENENTDESIQPQPIHLLLEEKQTLSTPSSLRGASKMMDEMIAKLYYDTKGIFSVGLRFFSVYGPWGVPGSPLFEMAERAVTGDLDGIDEEHEMSNFHSALNGIDVDENDDNAEDQINTRSHNWKKSIHDFVYIDDAVDAMMAAMQFRSAPPQSTSSSQPSSAKEEDSGRKRQNPHPIIFNVASGQGHSLEDILNVMQEFFPPKEKKYSSTSSTTTKRSDDMGTIGSIKRAESMLGYQPQVSLRDGIIKMLAWHYDRAFPYGGHGLTKGNGNGNNSNNSEENKSDFVTQQGIAGCLQYDKECLRGTPVFPCASECSHEAQCTKSYYDEVISLTQALTSECKTVLYTVDLDDSLVSFPSANPKLKTSKSFLKGTCNLAFVSQQSLLVKSIQNNSNHRGASSFMGSSSSSSSSSSGQRDGLFWDGSWVLIPLKVVPLTTTAADDDSSKNNGIDKNEILKLLPKLSPGLFFGAKNTKRAIYIDPDIMIDNIPKLLLEASAQPYSAEMDGATAMLIGRGTPKDYFADDGDEEEEMMMKLDDPDHQQQGLESTNTLVQNAAYRMVRIAVSDNLFGDGFMELLDSRWIVHGLQSDDGRLFRCDVLGEIVQWEVTSDRSALEFVLGLHDMWSRVIAKASGVGPWWIGDNVVTVPEGQQTHTTERRRLLEDEVAAVDDGENNADADADTNTNTNTNTNPSDQANTADDDESSEEDSQEQYLEDNSGEGEESERGEFVLDAVDQKEVTADEEKRGDSSDELQEDNSVIDENDKQESDDQESQRNFSSYDTWMGILSSSATKYFVRIVPSSEVGVMSIDRS